MEKKLIDGLKYVGDGGKFGKLDSYSLLQKVVADSNAFLQVLDVLSDWDLFIFL